MTEKQGGFTWHEPAKPAPYRRAVMPPSETEVWATPGWLFRALDREFSFTVDVAANATNAKCARYYTKEDNGLEQDWRGERVWCNPPYDQKSLTAFVGKGFRAVEADPSGLAVFLVPGKMDQAWWHEFALRSQIRYIRGRVAFGDAGGAPMPVCVLVFSAEHQPHQGISLYQPQRGLFDTP